LLLAEKMVKKGITKSVKMVYNNEKLAGQAKLKLEYRVRRRAKKDEI
jgi:hypothetical protein